MNVSKEWLLSFTLTSAGRGASVRLKKIYCEHGALTKEIKKLGRSGSVELMHFPFDPDSNAHLDTATPSGAQIRDLNLPIKDLPGTLGNYSASAHLEEIRLIIGTSNRRDALHIDSAFRNGCVAFVTNDRDILDHKEKLETLLGMTVFHAKEHGDLECFIFGPSA